MRRRQLEQFEGRFPIGNSSQGLLTRVQTNGVKRLGGVRFQPGRQPRPSKSSQRHDHLAVDPGIGPLSESSQTLGNRHITTVALDSITHQHRIGEIGNRTNCLDLHSHTGISSGNSDQIVDRPTAGVGQKPDSVHSGQDPLGPIRHRATPQQFFHGLAPGVFRQSQHRGPGRLAFQSAR